MRPNAEAMPRWIYMGDEQSMPASTPPQATRAPFFSAACGAGVFMSAAYPQAAANIRQPVQSRKWDYGADEMQLRMFRHSTTRFLRPGKAACPQAAMSNVGCRLPAVKCRLSNVGCRLSNVGCRLPAVERRLSVVGCRTSVVECRLSNVGCRMSAVERRLSNVGRRNLQSLSFAKRIGFA